MHSLKKLTHLYADEGVCFFLRLLLGVFILALMLTVFMSALTYIYQG